MHGVEKIRRDQGDRRNEDSRNESGLTWSPKCYDVATRGKMETEPESDMYSNSVS